MKKTIMTVCQLTLTGLLLVSCGGDPLEQAATAACDCVKPIYVELSAVKRALEQGDDSVMENRAPGLETADQVEACLNGVQKDFPGVDEVKLEQRLLEMVKQGACGKLD